MDTPKMEAIKTGKDFKVLLVEADQGMKVPPHHATGEAVLMVQEGTACLYLEQEEHLLSQGSTFIIPAKVEHRLDITSPFKAFVVLQAHAAIKFQ